MPGGVGRSNTVAGTAPSLDDEGLGIAGLHLFTLNNVAAAEPWRRRVLAH